jgi:hypothetical protein
MDHTREAQSLSGKRKRIMLIIKYRDIATNEEHTSNFTDLAAFELLDEVVSEKGVILRSWKYIDDKGRDNGGDDGYNAYVTLRACHGNMSDEEIDELNYSMSVNAD